MINRNLHRFPFSAIVGQDRLKLGLILNAISPNIGGLLIRGPKGTGKSTAVYSLAALLPEVMVVDGCHYNCDPYEKENLCEDCYARVDRGEELACKNEKVSVVNLPLSISEDRLIGSIDVETLLSKGQKTFIPGLLADANHNILYVDEINLLPDNVIDDLLDATASGWNVVEREGFSVKHPAQFVLVGTMNPEEGELRPQLLDRLPLSVSLETINNEEQRVEIIKRNLSFSQDSDGFYQMFFEEDEVLKKKISQAKIRLKDVNIMEHQLKSIASTCIDLKVDGQRPEIIITRTAITAAAFHERESVEDQDILDACIFALSHRSRDGGFEPPAKIDEIESTLVSALKKSQKYAHDSEIFRFYKEKKQRGSTILSLPKKKHNS